MSEFTYVKYSGTDAQILVLLKELFHSGNTPADHGPPPLEAESAASEPDKLRSIAEKFAYWLDKAAQGGSFGQRAAMTHWILKDGKVEYYDLIRASGAKNPKGWAPISNALTRNMRKAGGPQGGGRGIPCYPKTWFGWVKDPANDSWLYVIDAQLLPYLKAAFPGAPQATLSDPKS